MDIGTTLRDAIDSHLITGRWRPGQRIPTERELSSQFQVSRTTVRRVLAQFKDQKLITQVVGSGTDVHPRRAHAARPTRGRARRWRDEPCGIDGGATGSWNRRSSTW